MCQKHPAAQRYLALRELAARVTQAKVCCRDGDTGPVDYAKVCSALLRVRLENVRSQGPHGCWHALRLLHRTTMSLLCSEMMAEHVASVLRFLEKRHSVGRALSTRSLLDAAALRLHGVDGSVQTLPFLRSALREHFRGGEPHFFVDPAHRKRRQFHLSDHGALGPSATLQRHRAALEGAVGDAMFPWVYEPTLPPKNLPAQAQDEQPDGPLYEAEFSEEFWQDLHKVLRVFLGRDAE